jgi:hypothetical protein
MQQTVRESDQLVKGVAKESFSPAPLALLRESMPNLAKLVAIRLLGYRGRNAFASVGYERLARDLGTTPRQVAEVVNWLEQHGYITVTRDYRNRPVAFNLHVNERPFIAVPNELLALDLKPGPKLLLLRLLLHGSGEKTPVEKLALSLNVASDTIRRWRLELRKKGLLLVGLSRGRKANAYRLTPYVPRWREQPSQNGYALRDPMSVRPTPSILLGLQRFFPDRELRLVGGRTRKWAVKFGGFHFRRTSQPDDELERRLKKGDEMWFGQNLHEGSGQRHEPYFAPDPHDLDRAFPPSGSGSEKRAA